MNKVKMDSLDEKFVSNMKKLLGTDFVLYEKAMNEEPVRGIRYNPLKISKKEFLEKFPYDVEQISYENTGFVLFSEEKIGNTFLHMSGAVYLQEPSSMMPVSCIDVTNDAKVLDLCASPGGKSTQIATRITKGLIVSNEIVTNRAKILFSNIERMGIKNSVVLNDTPSNIAKNFAGYFDVVLVDAPCGGEGMFRKDPATIQEWSQDRLETNQKRQIEILCEADKCLKPGGKIVYSTCTFNEIENEDVIVEFLKTHNYRVLDVPNEVIACTKSGTKEEKARRFYPFSGKGEGQFVCVMEKISGDEICVGFRNNKTMELSKSDKNVVEKFLEQNFVIPNEYILIQKNESIMLVDENIKNICLADVNIVNAGIRIGTVEKGVLKPHHQLFMALGDCSKHKYDMTHEEAKKYIHGEELQAENLVSGFYTMCVDGLTLGGAKSSCGRLKNLLPKGIRV